MEERLRELAEHGPIVFYDGECGLCDRFVQYMLKIDKKHRLRYATLQGTTAAEVFPGPNTEPPETWSIKLVDAQGVHLRSDAALRAMAYVGGVWKAANLFLIVPRFIRDGVYRWVAKNRYRVFGRRESCMIPTPALRERFLP